MPGTVTGVLLFVILLAPGVSYSAVRRLTYPEREKSTFRETAGTVFVSAACLVVALLGFALLRAIWPSATTDVGELIRHPDRFFRQHYVEVFLWALGIILFASGVGALLAWRLPSPERAHFESAWHELFVVGWLNAYSDEPKAKMWKRLVSRQRRRPGPVFVGCELHDGSYISGVLNSFSTEVEETEDREISLVAPISYRPGGADEAQKLEVGTISVSARQLKFVAASYLPRGHVW
jgi:hypothetical protein